MRSLVWILTPLPCAVLFCLMNAWKPAVTDDYAYLSLALNIQENPAKPFGPPPDGCRIIWYFHSQGAFTLLSPLVVPYWLAVGTSLFGMDLVALKLWLFPFCLLFTASLAALFRRFSPGFEKPLLAVTILSPAFLPSLNVMIDIPAVALNLAAVVVFLKALDGERRRWGMLLLAGVLAGLASQTKYTGATSVVLMMGYSIARRRSAGLIASVLAMAIFVGWEAYLAQVYGRSHFLHQLQQRRQRTPDTGPVREGSVGEVSASVVQQLEQVMPLIGIVGGLSPGLIALALTALGRSRRLVLGVLGFFIVEFVILAFVPDRGAVFMKAMHLPRDEVSLGTIAMGINGSLFTVTLLAVSWKLLKRDRRGAAERLLIGWLLVELAACFLLTTFTAARRVMGILVVATLLVGRLLAREGDDPNRRRLVFASTLVGLLFGLLYFVTDYRDAQFEKRAALETIAWIRAQDHPRSQIWFTGHWGFQYYAEQEGARAVEPDDTIIEVGDWLIVPDSSRPFAQLILLNDAWAERKHTFIWYDDWPFRTIPEFYDGFQPIRHHEGPRMQVSLYLVRKKTLVPSP